MAYSNQKGYGQIWLERTDATQQEQIHGSSGPAAPGFDWSVFPGIGPTAPSRRAKKDASLSADPLAAYLRHVREFHRMYATIIDPTWERGSTNTSINQRWHCEFVSGEKTKTFIKVLIANQKSKPIEQFSKDALKITGIYHPAGAVPVISEHTPERPLEGKERYSVSSTVTNFVFRGIRASEEIAKQQLGTDHRWQALEREIPAEEFGTDLLTSLVTRRLHRMFRSLASAARDGGLLSRSLSNGASWAIDVQYDLIDRFPVRPDETSEFLRALLVDVFQGTRAARRITGGWGEIQIRNENELVMRIAATPAPHDEAVNSPSTVRFTRVRRGGHT
jgi:hypothetical protein